MFARSHGELFRFGFRSRLNKARAKGSSLKKNQGEAITASSGAAHTRKCPYQLRARLRRATAYVAEHSARCPKSASYARLRGLCRALERSRQL